jgi:hypothetical protein
MDARSAIRFAQRNGARLILEDGCVYAEAVNVDQEVLRAVCAALASSALAIRAYLEEHRCRPSAHDALDAATRVIRERKPRRSEAVHAEMSQDM